MMALLVFWQYDQLCTYAPVTAKLVSAETKISAFGRINTSSRIFPHAVVAFSLGSIRALAATSEQQ